MTILRASNYKLFEVLAKLREVFDNYIKPHASFLRLYSSSFKIGAAVLTRTGSIQHTAQQ